MIACALHNARLDGRHAYLLFALVWSCEWYKTVVRVSENVCGQKGNREEGRGGGGEVIKCLRTSLCGSDWLAPQMGYFGWGKP